MLKCKILRVLSLVIVIIACMSLTVSATENIIKPIERGPYQGTSCISEVHIPFDIDGLSKEEIIKKIAENYRAERVNTEADYARAEEILFLYNTLYDLEISVCSYDDEKAKLREGNLIELTLDLDENISNSTALKAISLANNAKSEAASNFPNTMDSAQHFIWNYSMTKSYNANTARTVGNNHEWGIMMIPYMENYFDEEYSSFLSQGYDSSTASSKALASTILYIPEFKLTSVELMQASYDFFTSVFSNDCIMDFWNNCYGRAYAGKGYSSAVNAYSAAKSAGEIILYSSNVNNDQKWCVWSWDWYTY